MNRHFLPTLLVVIVLTFIPSISFAVIPSDFILSIGTQISQFISITAIVTVTVVGSIFHFFKDVLTKKIKWILTILIVVIVVVTIYLKFFYTYAFFNDRLTLLYTDNNNQNQSLTINLFREEVIPHIYKHIYTVASNDQANSVKYAYNKHYSTHKFVSTDTIVSSFVNNNNYNTLNEEYSISVRLNNTTYDIKLPSMDGDILLNKDLYRLTYSNIGSGDIVVNSHNYKANFVLDKTLSNNARKSVAGANLQSKTNHAFLFDTDNNYYLIDTTIVTNPTDNYTSHVWTACKQGSVTEKSVSAGPIVFSNNNIIESINNVCFGKSLTINNKQSISILNDTDYLVSGFVTDQNNVTKNLMGVNLYVEN